MVTGPSPWKSSAMSASCMAGVPLSLSQPVLPSSSRGEHSMPMLLKGSCRCGAVRFQVASHTPAPFMLCYCSICRKQQGGGGYAINLGGIYETLKIKGKRSIGVYQAEIEDDERPHCEVSTGERNYC